MNRIYTSGPTIMTVEMKSNKSRIEVSIVSVRAAQLILKKTWVRQWETPVSAILPPLRIMDEYAMVGINVDGRVLVVSTKRLG